jgi:anti-sigma factor RsiW
MSCEESRLLLHAYVDGELDIPRTLVMEQHLETCAACSTEVKNHQTLRTAIQGASLYYQPPSVRKLMPAAKPGRTYPLFAVAAALLIAVGFFAGHLQPRGETTEQAVLDSHLRSLMPGHLADVQSTDQHTVKPWFNGKLDFSPPVTDLAQHGFPLAGGRVDSVEGRQVAALIYHRNQHVINVYVWPSRDAVSGRAARQGYNFVQWSQSGFEWWAISDLNAGELTDFAALLRAATP